MKKKLGILIMVIFVFVGCEKKKDFLLKVTPGRTPVRLAILPVNNLTNDVAGGLVFRNILTKKLEEKNKNYQIQDRKKTDQLLNEAGITDGGQLKFLRPIELCEILNVDGLIMMDINEISLLTYPYYHTRNVKITFYLYNFEKLIWAQPIRVSTKYMGINSALKTISGAINGDRKQMQKGFQKAAVEVAVHQGVKYLTIMGMNHELAPEMRGVGNIFLEVLPRGSRGDTEIEIKANKELKLLREKVSKKQSIITDDMYDEKKEPVEVIERNFTILN